MPAKKVTHIKLLEKIKLNDGTVLDKGTSVRFNHKEGPFFNVEFYDSHNVKRIFWITEDQGKISATRTERWSSKKTEEHQMDISETWFEQDQKADSVIKKKPVRKKISKKRI